MTKANNSLTLICYFPTKQIPVHRTTDNFHPVIFHKNNHLRFKTEIEYPNVL